MNVLERLVALYAPHSCLACGADGRILCDACAQDIPSPPGCCYRCGVDSRNGRTCRDCRQDTPLVSVNSVTPYDGVAKDLVWKLKFDRAQQAAEIIGGLLAKTYGHRLTADTLILPVPTATSRVRKRGYDQAALIAACFARRSGLTYAPLLMRLGRQEQIGASRRQRHDQLRNVFRIRRPQAVRGARIMLIDDVLTTGATMEEAARLLRAAGARDVGALTFVRA